jgi:3-deoxy-D-manno-octulosonic-acid transferase
MWRRGGYGRGFCQRFGCLPKLPKPTEGRRRLWVHGVSLGEVQSLWPLMEKLLGDGRYDIVCTATSSSGLSAARKLYGDKVETFAFPIDLWPFSSRAWSRIEPDVLVHADGELWPEHLHQAHIRSVPVVVANCRLSERSFHRHRRFRFFSGAFWSAITDIFPDGQATVERLRLLPGAAEKIHSPGNIKCDRPPLAKLSGEKRRQMLEEIGLEARLEDGSETSILVGCSTWPGEEEFLLDVLAELIARNPAWRLLIIPRHWERSQELRCSVERRQLPLHMRSSGAAQSCGATVSILDSGGELQQFVRLGAMAFLGKTLPPNGGAQSPVDAIAASVPLVAGPRTGNFADAIGELLRAGAILRGATAKEVAKHLLELGESEARRKRVAEAATAWLLRNGGVSDRICSRIGELAFGSAAAGR